ncbi:MAG TPA: hypothetical protein VEW70_01195, partial [Burkholderiales bacterium]|nr:hypothetical protein [Burkholderiales bacterium]
LRAPAEARYSSQVLYLKSVRQFGVKSASRSSCATLNPLIRRWFDARTHKVVISLCAATGTWRFCYQDLICELFNPQ